MQGRENGKRRGESLVLVTVLLVTFKDRIELDISIAMRCQCESYVLLLLILKCSWVLHRFPGRVFGTGVNGVE